MNIGILYGRDIDKDCEDAQVAKDVYDADYILFVDEVTPETLAEIKTHTGCATETILVVTNDDLNDVGVLRSLYSSCLQLAFVQHVKNLRTHYAHLYQIN